MIVIIQILYQCSDHVKISSGLLYMHRKKALRICDIIIEVEFELVEWRNQIFKNKWTQKKFLMIPILIFIMITVMKRNLKKIVGIERARKQNLIIASYGLFANSFNTLGSEHDSHDQNACRLRSHRSVRWFVLILRKLEGQ